jgi:hypothetical protein
MMGASCPVFSSGKTTGPPCLTKRILRRAGWALGVEISSTFQLELDRPPFSERPHMPACMEYTRTTKPPVEQPVVPEVASGVKGTEAIMWKLDVRDYAIWQDGNQEVRSLVSHNRPARKCDDAGCRYPLTTSYQLWTDDVVSRGVQSDVSVHAVAGVGTSCDQGQGILSPRMGG